MHEVTKEHISEVMKLKAKGWSDKAIAEKLNKVLRENEASLPEA